MRRTNTPKTMSGGTPRGKLSVQASDSAPVSLSCHQVLFVTRAPQPHCLIRHLESRLQQVGRAGSFEKMLFKLKTHPLAVGDSADCGKHSPGDADGEVCVGARAALAPHDGAPAVPRRLRLPELRSRAGDSCA
jgi:hypothetical protein